MIAISPQQTRKKENASQRGANDHDDEIGISQKALPIKDIKAKESGDAKTKAKPAQLVGEAGIDAPEMDALVFLFLRHDQRIQQASFFVPKEKGEFALSYSSILSKSDAGCLHSGQTKSAGKVSPQ